MIRIRNDYKYELEGQEDFYNYLNEMGILTDDELDKSNYVDGVIGNVLIENKLFIKDDYFKALHQMIKYQARRTWAGKPILKYMLAIGLNDQYVYVFNAHDFIDEIEAITMKDGSASKGNSSYHTEIQSIDEFNWQSMEGLKKIQDYKNSTELGPLYHVSEKTIVGLAKEVYKTTRMSKTQFLDEEIRYPTILSDRIVPYDKDTNEEFKKIMDLLNTQLMQRELGAFYTPEQYVKISQQYLLNAINNIPHGMDYVVIDRCAGTGNLEDGLPEDVLSHCILNTIEYEESLCLAADFGDKVLSLTQSDALETDILEEARPYVEDPNCVVIVYENPPYSEVAGGADGKYKEAKENGWKNSYICQQAKLDSKMSGKKTNDLANLFIWSAFKYYTTSENDSYIVYSPIKYWKTQHIIDRKLIDGSIMNRKNFHATESAITCIHWQNIPGEDHYKLNVIDENISIELNRISEDSLFSTWYDKRTFEDDIAAVACGCDGDEVGNQTLSISPIANYNKEHEILGYVQLSSNNLDAMSYHFTRLGLYAAHGCFIRSDDFLRFMPMIAVASYDQKWYEKGFVFKTTDGGQEYLNDEEFVRKCLLYVSLAANNKCKSLITSDGKKYRNELCFENNTIAKNKYDEMIDNAKMKAHSHEELNNYYESISAELYLKKAWDSLLNAVKTDDSYGKPEYERLHKEFGEDFTLGFWQIIDDININNDDNAKKKTKKYKKLDTAIKAFKAHLKRFYSEEISEKLFEYELIK